MVWCGAASMLLPAVNAVAAQVDMFLTIDGIKGEAAAGAIHVTSVVHQMDANSGMSVGKRQHNPITITKEVDSASPSLFKAATSHQVLKQVAITFQGSGAGAGKMAQKIVLTNATIASIKKVGNAEQITLNYETSEVTWTDGGKTAMDDWSVPK
jgi:type VI secretion system secreted protein Hcp